MPNKPKKRKGKYPAQNRNSTGTVSENVSEETVRPARTVQPSPKPQPRNFIEELPVQPVSSQYRFVNAELRTILILAGVMLVIMFGLSFII